MSKLLKCQTVGLPETEKQHGRQIDEWCWVRICICKECTNVKSRKINDEKGGDQPKKPDS